MNKSQNQLIGEPHSTAFCKKWAQMLVSVYHYKQKDKCLLIPSLFGKSTLVCLPLLNYTDIPQSYADQIIENPPYKRYQFRVLNSEYKEFKDKDPVAMRLIIKGKNLDELQAKCINSTTRRYIKKAENNNTLTVRSGNSLNLINDFYKVFRITMQKFGTPVIGFQVFNALKNFVDTTFFVAYNGEKPIAGLVMVCDENKDIFDFGRSPYGSGTFIFKSHWGAMPVKIDIIEPSVINVYKKYKIASVIWKRLPLFFTYFFGPFLCKYLKDL
jgi:hypothetical protein